MSFFQNPVTDTSVVATVKNALATLGKTIQKKLLPVTCDEDLFILLLSSGEVNSNIF